MPYPPLFLNKTGWRYMYIVNTERENMLNQNKRQADS